MGHEQELKKIPVIMINPSVDILVFGIGIWVIELRDFQNICFYFEISKTHFELYQFFE